MTVGLGQNDEGGLDSQDGGWLDHTKAADAKEMLRRRLGTLRVRQDEKRVDGPAVDPHNAIELAVQMAVDAVSNSVAGDIDTEVVTAMAREMLWSLMGFAKKHQDYGRNNISQGGEVGLLVRMNDKVQRMMTLHHSAAAPNNESMSDSIRDLASYAMILKVVRAGRWPGADERWAL